MQYYLNGQIIGFNKMFKCWRIQLTLVHIANTFDNRIKKKKNLWSHSFFVLCPFNTWESSKNLSFFPHLSSFQILKTCASLFNRFRKCFLGIFCIRCNLNLSFLKNINFRAYFFPTQLIIYFVSVRFQEYWVSRNFTGN